MMFRAAPPPVVIFTYTADSLLMLECVGALIDAGLKRVFIYEEAEKPLTAECKAALPPEVIVRQSVFARGTNLNGHACIAGMARCYLDVLEETGHSHVIKIDSDTLVLDAFGTLLAVAEDVTYMAATHPERFAYGWYQLISRRLAEALLNPAPEIDVREDVGTCMTAFALGGDVRLKLIDTRGGLTYGYQYGTLAPEAYLAFETVTFGDWLRTGATDTATQRRIAAAEMRRVREARHSRGS